MGKQVVNELAMFFFDLGCRAKFGLNAMQHKVEFVLTFLKMSFGITPNIPIVIENLGRIFRL